MRARTRSSLAARASPCSPSPSPSHFFSGAAASALRGSSDGTRRMCASATLMRPPAMPPAMPAAMPAPSNVRTRAWYLQPTSKVVAPEINRRSRRTRQRRPTPTRTRRKATALAQPGALARPRARRRRAARQPSASSASSQSERKRAHRREQHRLLLLQRCRRQLVRITAPQPRRQQQQQVVLRPCSQASQLVSVLRTRARSRALHAGPRQMERTASLA